MLSRLSSGISILRLSIAVAVLVIIGVIDFDLLVEITPRLIVGIVIVGIFVFIVKRLFFTKWRSGKGVRKVKHPVECPKCKGTGQVPRKDLAPMLKGPLAFGVRQADECPVCNGVGYVER